jgi:hypothetical protein
VTANFTPRPFTHQKKAMDTTWVGDC